jgi:hypothetical protein
VALATICTHRSSDPVPTAYRGHSMRKIIVLVEIFVFAAFPVTVIAINPQTAQMIVVASQAANLSQGRAMRKIIPFTQAAVTVAALTVHPQSAKPWPQ